MRSARITIVSAATAAAVICFIVHLKSLSCEFINWDDTDYLLNNQLIRSLDLKMIVRVFTSIQINYWIPLTWISYAIDYHFWGMNPTGYHLTNSILHAANTALLVLITDRLLFWRPEVMERIMAGCTSEAGRSFRYGALLLFAALLWGIHPARVESVAWATERKDVLNGLFLFTSIYFYLQYVRRRSSAFATGAQHNQYLLALLFFGLSLMAKPSGVVMPLMLLLLDWYPFDRFRTEGLRRIVLEKIPYLFVAGAVAGVTVFVGSAQGAFIPLSEFSLFARFIVIGNALFEYVKQVVHPASIIPYYHLPLKIPQIYILKAIIAYTLLAACLYLGKRQKWFIAAVLSFLVPLIPVLQFFPNGFQTAICTRYTYVPTFLLSVPLATLCLILYCKVLLVARRYAALVAGGLILLLLFYAGITQRLIGEWQNSGTFWSRVIATQPFERAYFYRGLYYVDVGRYLEAVQDYSSSLDLLAEVSSPEIFNLYAFRGEALAKAGLYADAVLDFDAAIAMFPHRLYFHHRGAALQSLGRLQEAAADMEKAGKAKGQMYWFPPGSALQ